MGKRKFKLHLSMCGEYVDSAIIELADRVIDIVDDEWREVLYDLQTPEEIAEHIGYNLIVNRISLSMMDGWAGFSDEEARIIQSPDLMDWDIEAEGWMKD